MDSTGQRGFQPIWDKDKTKINPETKRVRFVWEMVRPQSYGEFKQCSPGN